MQVVDLTELTKIHSPLAWVLVKVIFK
jgi:hypothetical protein